MNLRQAGRWLRDAYVILGVTLTFCVVLELVCTVIWHFRDRGPVDARSKADTYDGAPWAEQYYRELSASSAMQWASYVYWRRLPYRGQYVNVNDDGLRATWQPDRPAGSDGTGSLPKVFFFGGSTMWGTGARDDYTIPSCFARRLAAQGLATRTTNFGETGYVSTQQVIALMRELQVGNVPDLVLFFSGTNDTFSAYQRGKAGIPQNEQNRRQEFGSRGVLTMSILRRTITNLAMVKCAKGLLRRSRDWRNTATAEGVSESSPQPVANVDELALGVLDVYANNVRITQALANHYGFKALFYWQPTIFGKSQLTPYETNKWQLARDYAAVFARAHALADERVRAICGEAAAHDLSDIFATVPEPLFIDWCHLGEAGNDLIAARMVTDALPLLGGVPRAKAADKGAARE